MLPEKSFAARLLGMIDLFLIWQLDRALDRVSGAVPPPDAADRNGAAGRLRHHCGDRRVRPTWSWGMSGKKKIFIGVGIVVAAGRRSRYANIKFKRIDGPGSHDRRRCRSGTSKRSCPHRARFSRSATSTSAPTRWAGSPISRSRKATASPRDSSCSRSIRATCGRRCSGREASLAAATLAGRTAAGLDRELEGGVEAGRGQLQPPAEPLEGRAHHPRDARDAGERSEAAPGGPALAGTAAAHAAAADGVRERHGCRARASI